MCRLTQLTNLIHTSMQARAAQAERRAQAASKELAKAEARIDAAEKRAKDATSALAWAERRAVAADAELASAGGCGSGCASAFLGLYVRAAS